ncbi:MAG: hypothetical protein ACYDBJ_17620 [Aggregatilineales bacterium]
MQWYHDPTELIRSTDCDLGEKTETMTLSNIPASSVISALASIGVTLFRIVQDRSPQRGLRYSDLEVRLDDLLAYKISSSTENLGDIPPHKKSPYTHFIQITNFGREVIDEGDYIRPFCVRYNAAAEVIGYRVIRDKRTVQPKIYESEKAGIQIKETLNPGDTFTLGVLLASTANPGKPVVDCRIKGIRHLKGHLRGDNWLEVLWHLTVHYLAVPLSIIAGLVVGYRIFLATTLNSSPVLDSLNVVVNEFGAGVFGGLLTGVLLATLVEIWQFYSFRRHRRSAEDSFRAAAREHLDKPLPAVTLQTRKPLITG